MNELFQAARKIAPTFLAPTNIYRVVGFSSAQTILSCPIATDTTAREYHYKQAYLH